MLAATHNMQAFSFAVATPQAPLASVPQDLMSAQDLAYIEKQQIGQWYLSLLRAGVLPVQERSLRETPSLEQEFLTAQAVLALQVKAVSVLPVAAVERVLLIDYTPYQRKDPPVPLLVLTPLPNEVQALFHSAVKELLEHQNAALLARATKRVLRAGVGCLSKAEAFYFFTKVTSLVTGAYTQTPRERTKSHPPAVWVAGVR